MACLLTEPTTCLVSSCRTAASTMQRVLHRLQKAAAQQAGRAATLAGLPSQAAAAPTWAAWLLAQGSYPHATPLLPARHPVIAAPARSHPTVEPSVDAAEAAAKKRERISWAAHKEQTGGEAEEQPGRSRSRPVAAAAAGRTDPTDRSGPGRSSRGSRRASHKSEQRNPSRWASLPTWACPPEPTHKSGCKHEMPGWACL